MTTPKKATKKTAVRTPRARRAADPLDPLEIGNGDESEVADGVIVRRTPGGRAVLVPRSLRNLRGDAEECMAEVQKAVGVIHEAQQDLDQLVTEARDLGVSWGGIGWCVGTSEQAARQRWGQR